MRRSILPFADDVLRGFGQWFLANRAASGALVLAGLLAASPAAAGWAVLGACLVTAGAWVLGARNDADSGLYGINGALLGYSWALVPEVPFADKAALTLLGAAVVLAILIPGGWWLRRRGGGVTLFALPYVLAVWLNLGVASWLGAYDPNLSRGWQALASGEPSRAEAQFAAARPSAWREDGLGWAGFRRGEYAGAAVHFHAAVDAKLDLWDARDGAGWCHLMLGQTEQAGAMFRAAVDGDPLLASSWDGLGWLELASGDPDAAADCFRRAVAAAPLFRDPHASLAKLGHDPGALGWLSRAVAGLAPGSALYVPTGQLIGWACFLAAIAWHSRGLAALVLAGLGGCYAVAQVSPSLRPILSDATFLYNLIPLLLALGGQYLRWSALTMAWMVGAVVVLAVTWVPLCDFLAGAGLPILCLPFNLLLVASLVTLGRAGRLSPVVPLEVAVTSPAGVRLWRRKVTLARACWEVLGGVQPGDLTPPPPSLEGRGGRTPPSGRPSSLDWLPLPSREGGGGG